MSKSNKVVKYKIINTNIDKTFIGKDLDLQRVKTKGGDGGRKPPRPRQAPTWFVEFEKRNNQRFDKIEKDISNLNNRFNNLVKVNNLKE